MRRYEAALRAYAEAEFWEGDFENSPAGHDRGEIARHTLLGKEPPIQFHD